MSTYPHTLASCQETMGSHKFLPFLSIHATLQDTDSPSEISPLRFLCIGFRHHKNVTDCTNKLTMLTASGICASLVAYMVLCVRFVSFVHICRSRNRLQRSARNGRDRNVAHACFRPITSTVSIVSDFVANGYQTIAACFHKPPYDPGKPDFPVPVLTLIYLLSSFHPI